MRKEYHPKTQIKIYQNISLDSRASWYRWMIENVVVNQKEFRKVKRGVEMETAFFLLLSLTLSAFVQPWSSKQQHQLSNNNNEASLMQSKACQSTTARRASMKVADEENGRVKENCMRFNFTPNKI